MEERWKAGESYEKARQAREQNDEMISGSQAAGLKLYMGYKRASSHPTAPLPSSLSCMRYSSVAHSSASQARSNPTFKMQHQIIILLLVSLAAFSQSANTPVPQVKLPDSFTCKAAVKGKQTSHTFQGAECTKAIALLAKGKAPSAACGQCLLGLVGEDGNAFTPTQALDAHAILASVKNIADGCINSAQSNLHNQKRDSKPSGNNNKASGSAPPKIQVVLGLPKEKAQC